MDKPLSAETRARDSWVRIYRSLGVHEPEKLATETANRVQETINKAITSAEEAARADERELCAVIAEQFSDGTGFTHLLTKEAIAQAIRSRNKEGDDA